jgi:hypothetical protein
LLIDCRVLLFAILGLGEFVAQIVCCFGNFQLKLHVMDTNDVSHNIEALISTNKLVQALKERVLFLDGGLATQLEEKGIVLHRLLW